MHNHSLSTNESGVNDGTKPLQNSIEHHNREDKHRPTHNLQNLCICIFGHVCKKKKIIYTDTYLFTKMKDKKIWTAMAP